VSTLRVRSREGVKPFGVGLLAGTSQVHLGGLIVFSALISLLLLSYAGDDCCAKPGPCQCCKSCDCPSAFDKVRVIRVVDGDTIEVARGDVLYKVRLIGVDTPETVDTHRGPQPFGKEASAHTKAMLEGRDVHLEFEKNRLDGFSRLIAYVYLDGRLVNEHLIREGYGRYYRKFKFNPDLMKAFAEAEADAKLHERGLWHDDGQRDAGTPLQPVPREE